MYFFTWMTSNVCLYVCVSEYERDDIGTDEICVYDSSILFVSQQVEATTKTHFISKHQYIVRPLQYIYVVSMFECLEGLQE